ncbi:MAG: pyridoxal phosphate-dependent aminotransferase [Candidatus Hodarchaeota archaeon]
MIKDFSSIPISPVVIADSIAKVERLKGIRVVRFDVAEPYFDPPPSAIESTITALKEGYRRYAPTRGLLELREAIAEFLGNSRALKYGPDDIIVTPGAKYAIYSFFASVLSSGDEVVLLTPYWSSFKAVPLLFGCEKIKEVLTKEPYIVDEERLKEAITPRTKVLVINTPNNPTGGVLDEQSLQTISDLTEDYEIFILSDEVDWAYMYEGRKHTSQASIKGARDRTLVVDSFSKVFAMTGWRIGYAAGPRDLIDAMNIVQQHSVTGPTTFIQRACIDVLKEAEPYVRNLLIQSSAKRETIIKGLRKIDRLNFQIPEGAFYIYPNAKNFGMHTDELSRRMLFDAGVAVAPGTLFGAGGEYNFRICYALPERDLEEGINRLIDFFSKL